jgi:hypothetical protein
MTDSRGVLRLPLDGHNGRMIEAQVWAEWPLTPDQWDRMLLILEAMRPGLVGNPVSSVMRFLSSVLVTP